MIKANWVILEHVNTKVQIADIFTKAIVKSESWLQLTDLAQIRAVKSGKPPMIDLVKKPKKKKVDSDTNQEQVSPSPKAKSKAKSKKKSAKKRVAAATVLAAAVNLIGCQLLTLSRVDGFIETLGIHSLVTAQASKGVRGVVSVPSDQLTTMSLEPDSSGMLNWQREAQVARERLDRRPAAEGQETQQQNTAAAEGGAVPNVGGTPVPVAPPEAHAASSARRFLGGRRGLVVQTKTTNYPNYAGAG
jgi:hypothetical protein